MVVWLVSFPDPRSVEGGSRDETNQHGCVCINSQLLKLVYRYCIALHVHNPEDHTFLPRRGGYCRDKNMEDHIQEKLTACQRYLHQLQKDENMTQKNITSKSERKKLAVF